MKSLDLGNNKTWVQQALGHAFDSQSQEKYEGAWWFNNGCICEDREWVLNLHYAFGVKMSYGINYNPLNLMVGMRGFEPPTLWPRDSGSTY